MAVILFLVSPRRILPIGELIKKININGRLNYLNIFYIKFLIIDFFFFECPYQVP